MVASVGPSPTTPLPVPQEPVKSIDSQNRVLHVLVRRLGASKTFGENMIFMLNRASACLCATCVTTQLKWLPRSYSRGFVHATIGAQTSILAFHNKRDIGVLLH